ncbi:MAG: GNAT family N-acetyltransferase [Bacteroidetes bacterium]|nr:GNAT family N-acetyltransferase [Bacteroidota bacterium]
MNTPSDRQSSLIRAARPDDLQELLSIESSSFSGDRISSRSFVRFLRQPSSRILVAEMSDHSITGYALVLLRRNSRKARLYSIAVDPVHRGSGVGTQLLGAIESTVREMHCLELSLEVRTDNTAAIDIYQRHGFVVSSTKPNYYEDGAGALVLQKSFSTFVPGQLNARSRVPVVLVDQTSDLPEKLPVGRTISISDYLQMSHRAPGRVVINLARSYEHLARGYYASLLAEARGERCYPGAFNLLDINWKRIHLRALNELSPVLEAAAGKEPFPESMLFFFGESPDPRFRELGQLLFDRFRCPILQAWFGMDQRPVIEDIEALPVTRLASDERSRFVAALTSFLKSRHPVSDRLPRAATSIAILVEPEEERPPSDAEALERFRLAAFDIGARLTFITKKDQHRIGLFDALLIRTTTSLDHYTYRFARKAADEGIPVIDSPENILQCTNKIFLYELLKRHGIPTPETTVFDSQQLENVCGSSTWPSVLKVPDSCFSLGVFRVDSPDELRARAKQMFKESDLLLIQSWVPTEFDWRIGVLDGAALFACRYFMAKGHWQIADNEADEGVIYGETDTVDITDVPSDILDVAVRAAKAVGSGLLGVDVKQTSRGPLVIEVNDNPNLDADVEDLILGPDLYRRILSSLTHRVGLPVG